MIKPSEVRIGLYFRYPNSAPFQVTKEDLLNEDFWTDISENIQPIPLTAEILEKCGLEQHRNSININGEQIGVIWPIIEDPKEEDWRPQYQLGIYVYSGLGDPESYGFKVNIQYLHQLQNLYFALTGEELEVNLPVLA